MLPLGELLGPRMADLDRRIDAAGEHQRADRRAERPEKAKGGAFQIAHRLQHPPPHDEESANNDPGGGPAPAFPIRNSLWDKAHRLSRRLFASLPPRTASTIKLTLTLPRFRAPHRGAQSFRQG
ncbi:hypothetical protein [Methylosinus sp. PW1]|uniref:hypothetical protein n=1 Tax=Methylosinus sp. PW1 TaxID=107636 RepID=UPI0005696E85|nr:hypothetical protein [Methylosinus sp. PW1]